MGKIYKQWRDLAIDPFSINYKNIKLKKIISYPPAGNDVVECKCYINDQIKNVFIKIERSKMAAFQSEINNLNILINNNYYNKIPHVYENGYIDDKQYMVLEKINGKRLSDIFEKVTDENKRKSFLLKYGKELAIIHSISPKKFKLAKQRVINDYPKEEIYSCFDSFIKSYVDYLKENKPLIKYNTFIHGDFHYANILWKNNKISGIVDFEYSGKGFKEQDIAWACILRPTQFFMDKASDIKYFIEGYLKIGNFNKKALKWCLLNAYAHFYLMNINNVEYKTKLQNLILQIDMIL